MLLDGCCKVDFDTITRYFTETLERPITDLKVIIVTHMHPDHAGCAHKLQKASGASIFTGPYTKHWYGGLKGRIAHIIDMALALWVADKIGKPRKNIWYSPILKPSAQLPDNTPIPMFEDWRLIRTPGHTNCDVSLVNHNQKLLYVADLIVQVKKQLTPPFPVYFPVEYKSSLNRIKALSGYTMLMAHVSPIQITSKAIDSVLNKAPQYPKTNYETIKKKLKNYTKKNKT